MGQADFNWNPVTRAMDDPQIAGLLQAIDRGSDRSPAQHQTLGDDLCPRGKVDLSPVLM